MSQNLPVAFAGNNNLANVLPAEAISAFGNLFHDSFSDFGSSFRRIRVGRLGFSLIGGQSVEEIPADRMFVVCLGVAPTNHAVWYERAYTPGQEGEQPDLVWNMPDWNTFPDALPVQFRSKVMRDGLERWAFQVRRRMVFAIMRHDANNQPYLDLDNPYAMDLSSMSLFSKSNAAQNMYRWGGLRDVCVQYSNNGVQITPAMFISQIVIDTTVSITGPVFFRPMRDSNGHLQILDPSLLLRIVEVAQSQQVRDMLTIAEKLSYDRAGNTQTVPPVQQAAPAPQPAPVQAPAPQPEPVAAPAPQPAPVQAPAAAPQPAAASANTASLLAQAEAVLNQKPTAEAKPAATGDAVSDALGGLLAELG